MSISLQKQLVLIALGVGMSAPLVSDGAEPSSTSDSPATRATVDFAEHVAPILKTHCLGCHGTTKARGGLRLNSLESLLKGGHSGKVIEAGDGAKSRLMHVVSDTDDDGVVMPPEPNARLKDEEISFLRSWIDQGAKWPKGIVLSADPGLTTLQKGQDHWALKPIKQPPAPEVKQLDSARNPIDQFVLQRLEKEGISPSPAANPAVLIRRVTLDLTGLPPTPDEVAQFTADTQPDAYDRLVDRLLASSHYGEKWARHWLDLAHYADTDGYLTDQARPVAWRYRNWLIEALNRDQPFDRFTIEQLAGDLLPEATVEQKIATGFLRNTLSNREGGADLEEYRVEQIVDRTQIVGTTWLGLTVGCARCHDHKYDPISQEEFYQLYAFFDNADEVNIPAPLPGELEAYHAKLPEYQRKRQELLAPVQQEIAKLQTRWEEKLLEAATQPGRDPTWDRQWEVLGLVWGGGKGEGQLEGTTIVLLEPVRRTESQQDRLLDYFLQVGSVIAPLRFKDLKLEELQKQLEQLKKDFPQLTRAPAIQQAQIPRQAFIHIRGDFRRKGPGVAPGTLAALPVARDRSKLDRLTLARWLVSDDNPLPARVTVNRFWQEFFGRGLVATTDNFGTQGEPPSHPELLDWLASEFRHGGWSMKAIHRLMVTSATYRQSSRVRSDLVDRDPNNILLARQRPLRLSADQVRDTTLSVAGLLNQRIGGPSVFPPQPETVAKEGFENKWQASEGADRYRRGLYTYIQRLSPFAQSITFDLPSLSRSCTRREQSNTPLQALTLLNDPVFFEAAQAFAARLLKEPDMAIGDRIEQAFRLALGRPPQPEEKARLVTYYEEQMAVLRNEPDAVGRLSPQLSNGKGVNDAATWSCLCSVIMNLHEFITRE